MLRESKTYGKDEKISYSRISEFRGVFLKLLLQYFKELLNILTFYRSRSIK